MTPDRSASASCVIRLSVRNLRIFDPTSFLHSAHWATRSGLFWLGRVGTFPTNRRPQESVCPTSSTLSRWQHSLTWGIPPSGGCVRRRSEGESVESPCGLSKSLPNFPSGILCCAPFLYGSHLHTVKRSTRGLRLSVLGCRSRGAICWLVSAPARTKPRVHLWLARRVDDAPGSVPLLRNRHGCGHPGGDDPPSHQSCAGSGLDAGI